MKIIAIISRFLLGVVFIFSGFVKAVDPMGSTYKFVDYFNAFGIPSLELLAFPLAILLSTAEFVIGIALFVGLRMRITSWAATLFMVFFTILTFFLAIFNPVTDCGCFGDAIILTNWRTFFKNLIFLIPTAVIFFYREKYNAIFCTKAEWLFVGVFSLFAIIISIYGYRHLPILDFRPYNVGTYIPEKMEIPEGAPQDEYESIFYYEKNGEVKEFNKDNYPWQDTTWKFVDAEHNLIKQGYIPPIHDFIIENETEGDITDVVLYSDGYYLIIVAPTLEKSNINGFMKMNEIASFVQQYNIPTICITSTVNDELLNFKQKINPVFEFYNTDEITLKTIIRSNPGLVLLYKGTIIDKWHFNDLPQLDEINENFIGKSISKYKHNQNTFLIFSLFFLSILILSIYGIIQNYLKRL